MLPKGVWKMMLALEKYFWKNNKNKKTTERIYIPSLLLDCDSAAAGSLDVEAAVTLACSRRLDSGERSEVKRSAKK